MGGGSGGGGTTTSVFDLAPWVKPWGHALLRTAGETLLPTNSKEIMTADINGRNYRWLNDNEWDTLSPEEQADLASRGILRASEVQSQTNGGLPTSDKWRSYEINLGGEQQAPPPHRPYEVPNMWEGDAWNDIIRMTRGYEPQHYDVDPMSRRASGAWLDYMAPGNNPDLAAASERTFLGGDMAGASRMGLMDILTGNTARAGEQAFMDSMYGKTANAADQALYTMLGQDRGLTRQGFYDTVGGQGADLARTRSMGTASGQYTQPGSNPYLQQQIDQFSRAYTDHARDVAMPAVASQYARAGLFGGSAHQQAEAMEKYNLGRGLSEGINDLLSQNYQTERGYQESAIDRERGYTEQALQAALDREANIANSLYGGRNDAAFQERDRMSQIAMQTRQMEQQAYQDALARSIEMMLMPEALRSQEFGDITRALSMGERASEYDRLNRQIIWENQLQDFEWPFRILEMMGGVLGGALGNTSSNSTFSSIDRGDQAVTQGIGGGMAGLGALAGILSGDN